MLQDLSGPAPTPTDDGSDARPKVGVLVVAYNAESTLQATLDRIPDDLRPRIDEILICDDASQDNTVDAGLAWREANGAIPTTVIRHVSNLGYGGNQKAGYQLAIERGLDIVVLLHADGQYAPEAMGDLLGPLERDEADAVFGSRMLQPGSARAGGMPLYKYLGNKALTAFENRLLGSSLSEFHSGYRAYRLSALAELPIEFNTDDFDFDTQIIVQLLDAGKRIVEVPIPTYYGDEICYVDGVKYARDVVRDVAQYRLAKVGIGTPKWVPSDPEYGGKEAEGTSHTVITGMLADLPSGRVLDLGCSGGRLSERIRALGHKVVGVDSIEIPGVRSRVDDFFLGDLEDGIAEEVGGDYDVVVAADVIEHVRDPERLLRQMAEVLSPTGQIIISTPNFGHWYSRGRVAAGAFDYDRRGILDETHLRFFSRKGLRRTISASGLDIVQLEYTGLPFEVLTRDDSWKSRSARRVDRKLVELRPTVFGYQFVARLRPHNAGSVTHYA